MKKTINTNAVRPDDLDISRATRGIAVISTGVRLLIARIESDEIADAWEITPGNIDRYKATQRENQCDLWPTCPDSAGLDEILYEIVEIIPYRDSGYGVVSSTERLKCGGTMVDIDIYGGLSDLDIDDLAMPDGILSSGGDFSTGWAMYGSRPKLKKGDIIKCR